MSSIDEAADGASIGRSHDRPEPARKSASVTAGFGSPADDSTVKRIDLNDALIVHSEATFVMRAKGSAMHGAGIDDGDVLIVDRSLTPVHGQVIVAIVENELVCRSLHKKGKTVKLVAPESSHSDITFKDGAELEAWGVVTYAVKAMPRA